jgi:hypothetical protein
LWGNAGNVILCFNREQIFVHSFHHQLGRTRRDLNQLEAEKLLVGSAADLAAIGYHFNFGLDESESLLSLTSGPLSQVLHAVAEPAGLVFQHCYAESAVSPYDPGEPNIALRTRYFPGEVMRHLQIDHVPYFCSFASGCCGFMSLLGAAGGVLSPSLDNRSMVCVMADCMPPGVPYNMMEERILGSDQSSAFVVGRQECGYQLLGINYYSTTRTKVPFVEIVKRTVQMIQELAQRLNLELTAADVAIHYPNIFPATWKMVTRYLQLPRVEHILDGIADRAHCGATDSVISLAKDYRMQVGRLHVAVNYGVGLHLGVCMLRETGTPWSEFNN